MRGLLVLVVAAIPVAAQKAVVLLTNATSPARTDFQIGDRFEIVITGTAGQLVSVRTTMNGRTGVLLLVGLT